MLQISSELRIKDFYCVFVRTEMNLIAFSRSRNCVNTQFAALSGAMPQDSFSWVPNCSLGPPNSIDLVHIHPFVNHMFNAVFINIYESANYLICICNNGIIGLCLSFDLILSLVV